MKKKEPPKPRNVPARNLARPECKPRVIPDKRQVRRYLIDDKRIIDLGPVD